MSTATKLSSSIEPATRKFLDEINASKGPQIYELSVEEARSAFVGLQSGKVDKPQVDVELKTIRTEKSGEVSIRIVRPKGEKGILPAVMYFHGAGWVLGGYETHERLVCELTAGAHAALVFVEFSLSPEAQYPTAIEQAYAATSHVAENAAALNLDVSRLVVAGDSVGGNMAIAVTLLAKERGGPKIAQQILFYPVTDASFSTQSYRDFATQHFLSLEAMKWFWNHYLPDANKRKEITASPINATGGQLANLPPALIMTAEFDVLRDEGEAYAHKLADAGVRVQAARFLGTIHDFVLLNAITDTPAPRAAIALAIGKMNEVFGRK